MTKWPTSPSRLDRPRVCSLAAIAEPRSRGGGRCAVKGARRGSWPAGLGDYSARPLGRVGPRIWSESRWRRRLVSRAGPAARLCPLAQRVAGRGHVTSRDAALRLRLLGAAGVKHPALAGGGAGGPGPTLIGPSRSREANGSPS